MEAPETIDNFQKRYANPDLFGDPTKYTKIKDTPYGPLYKQNSLWSRYTAIQARSIYLVLKDKQLVTYDFDNKPNITINGASYVDRILVGCSGPFGTPILAGYEVEQVLADKVEVGKSGSLTLYQINNPKNYLINDLYDNVYTVGRDIPQTISIEAFAKGNSNIIYQDSLGDWRILINEKYGSMAECGKPVIYLYPQQDTQVTVQVGANITVSEPLYPQEGWTVLAHPNGQLEYQGKTYPNLFWEGQGKGFYPNVKDQGVVVSQKNLVSALKAQLRQLGLNEQESKDFMDFWQEKLPTTPFVRLTWLGTQDMDRLAPLTVSPAPQTRIRIFLEFEGLQKPITLKEQKLSAPQRNGYTLIEWGGLLIK